jgi:hypothetical protein
MVNEWGSNGKITAIFQTQPLPFNNGITITVPIVQVPVSLDHSCLDRSLPEWSTLMAPHSKVYVMLGWSEVVGGIGSTELSPDMIAVE